MQLNCPNCENSVTSENINIQEMVAVCSNCDTIFSFENPNKQAKQKRRKVHQPPHIDVQDSDTGVSLSFRTNFRLDKDESFVSSAIAGIAMMFVASIMISEAVTDAGMPLQIPLMFALAAIAFFYWTATIVYNKTHIEMSDDSIRVSRQPIPSLASHRSQMSTYNIKSIYTEESDISKKEAYDTPRYHVWAEINDGSRKVIIKDVVEGYGAFIAQYLNENLHGFDEETEQMSTERLAEKQFDESLNPVTESQATRNGRENYRQ